MGYSILKKQNKAKKKRGSWRDGSDVDRVIKNTYCSYRGPQFSSEHPDWVLSMACNSGIMGSVTLSLPPWALACTQTQTHR